MKIGIPTPPQNKSHVVRMISKRFTSWFLNPLMDIIAKRTTVFCTIAKMQIAHDRYTNFSRILFTFASSKSSPWCLSQLTGSELLEIAHIFTFLYNDLLYHTPIYFQEVIADITWVLCFIDPYEPKIVSMIFFHILISNILN